MNSESLSQLLDAQLGLRTTTQSNRVVSAVGTSIITVLRQDPARVGFTFINLSPNRIFVSPFNDPSALKGILVGPNGGAVGGIWSEDFSMVAWEWFAISEAPGSNVLILELVALASASAGS